MTLVAAGNVDTGPLPQTFECDGITVTLGEAKVLEFMLLSDTVIKITEPVRGGKEREDYLEQMLQSLEQKGLIHTHMEIPYRNVRTLTQKGRGFIEKLRQHTEGSETSFLRVLPRAGTAQSHEQFMEKLRTGSADMDQLALLEGTLRESAWFRDSGL